MVAVDNNHVAQIMIPEEDPLFILIYSGSGKPKECYIQLLVMVLWDMLKTFNYEENDIY
jgi:acyl-coenzyme A synthetase/AMP-(fatty) acid ligase